MRLAGNMPVRASRMLALALLIALRSTLAISRREGDREHVARSSRHVAGFFRCTCTSSFATSFAISGDFPIRIFGADCKGDSAPRGKLCGDDDLARDASFHKIVKDAVGDGFIERALVAIRREIEFQGLALDTETVGHVIDIDPSKIGLTGYRAHGSEIVRFEVNAVISFRSRILKRLQARFGW
jgi:hypothetical protein